ncbi:MAG: protoporphyrinogen oxidase [Deltaproteobacteria bacterium]|nr:protoporphyrinogen oxidase [Deltaproteobacteria bacterium]
MRTCDVAVVGGGIAGLAAAWRLRSLGQDCVLFEAARAVGGKMRSERRDGYLVEHGPNSFLGSAKVLWRIIESVGLQGEVLPARKPAWRYVYRDRRARRLPLDPVSLLTGDYLSARGKLRLLCEPLVPGGAKGNDTAWQFAERRLGREAARYLMTPFVSGVYAGDVHQLSARDAFPRLWNWEHAGGSVTVGALLAPPEPTDPEDAGLPTRRGMYSFREGLGALPRAIAQSLPTEAVRMGTPIASLESRDGGWLVSPHPTLALDKAPVFARAVVVALPSQPAAELLGQIAPRAAQALAAVQTVRVAVVHVGGQDPQDVAPRGFGVLIPPGEGQRALGILFPSSVFDDRAPPGHCLHTGFFGGACDPEAVDLPDDVLADLVVSARGSAFASSAQLPDPTFVHVVRWRQAIPQYGVGHRARMASLMHDVTAHWPGLALAGSHLEGVSVADSAASGVRAVDALLAAGHGPLEART